MKNSQGVSNNNDDDHHPALKVVRSMFLCHAEKELLPSSAVSGSVRFYGYQTSIILKPNFLCDILSILHKKCHRHERDEDPSKDTILQRLEACQRQPDWN